MKMRTILLSFLCGLLLMACQQFSTKETQEKNILHVAVLRGPSALAFAEWNIHPPVIGNDTCKIQWIDSPEQMQALLIKQEADIAVLPMINAANLYNKHLPYLLAGCPLWGTLYLAGRKGIEAPICLFGRGTTPDLLARQYLSDFEEKDFNYTFNSAPELLQALLAGKAHTAVLSEPFLSIALQRDSTLRILADLNNPQQGKAPGFPQTAIVFHRNLSSFRQQIDSLITQSCQYTNQNPQQAISSLEQAGLFASGSLDTRSVQRCRITYLSANKAAEAIRSFLQLIYKYEPRVIGQQIPDSSFISPAS